MKEKADKANSRTGMVITLIVGLAIGSVCTASVISLLMTSMDLWVAYAILGLIFLISSAFLTFWVYKKELFNRVVGVELKDISVLLHDVVEDITNKDVHNLKDRAYEAGVVWTTIKTRMALISLLVFLATSLFLMLNAYVMFRQNDLIAQQIEIMADEKKIIAKQVKISEQEKMISKFHLTEKILDFVRTHNKNHKAIITTISRCGKIYNSDGGANNYQEINDYLAFIDDFALYEKEGLFSIDKTNELLGYYFLSFYRNNNGEMKEYIEGVRKSLSSQFYNGLLSLLNRLESLPENAELIKNIDRVCELKNKENHNE